MQRSDFVLLSRALRDARERAKATGANTVHGVDLAAHDIADAISERHTGFDANRFFSDIGVPQIIAR